MLNGLSAANYFGNCDETMKLLAIDVGNTNLVFGVFNNDRLEVSWRLSTVPSRTADELWMLVSRLLTERKIKHGTVDGVIMSSVVPELTSTMSEMVSHGFNRSVVVVDETKVGIPVLCKNPGEVGADRLVNAVGALDLFGSRVGPIVVIDFGTATTFDVISKRGEYQGGVICPGIEISADALFERAARLPRVVAEKPLSIIGQTTIESMQSGLFFGYLAMVEGIIGRLAAEFSESNKPLCVATGGLAQSIAVETNTIDEVCPNLTLHGLRLVWTKNQ